MKKTATKKSASKKTADTLYVNFVLDETGSMESCKDATISGFNEYISTLKKKAQNVVFTLTKFNSKKVETLFKAKAIKEVPELNSENYQPDKMTPLYDAIAKTIHDTEIEAKGKDVLCVIMSDGEENSSKEYTREKIFDLIKSKEKDKWAFVYLGANQDSWQVGQAIGLNKNNVMNYSSKNTKVTMQYMSNVTSSYASSSQSARASLSTNILTDKDNVEKDLTA